MDVGKAEGIYFGRGIAHNHPKEGAVISRLADDGGSQTQK